MSNEFIEKNCNNKIPEQKNEIKNQINSKSKLKKDIPNLIKLIDKQDLTTYIKKVVDYSFEANKYFNDSEPWAVKKISPLLNQLSRHECNLTVKVVSSLSKKKIYVHVL